MQGGTDDGRAERGAEHDPDGGTDDVTDGERTAISDDVRSV